jgi:hypothetical protein
MAIEAPYSKYCKTNFKIAIAVCVGGAIIFAYDGYLSKYEWSLRHIFYEEHIKDGKADSTLVFNQKAPFVLGPLAVVLIAWFLLRRREKLIADELGLSIYDCRLKIENRKLKIANRNSENIPYDSIQKIDKTYFNSKGYFVITYKNNDGVESNRKLSAKQYDNLKAILEHLVSILRSSPDSSGATAKDEGKIS